MKSRFCFKDKLKSNWTEEEWALELYFKTCVMIIVYWLKIDDNNLIRDKALEGDLKNSENLTDKGSWRDKIDLLEMNTLNITKFKFR